MRGSHDTGPGPGAALASLDAGSGLEALAATGIAELGVDIVRVERIRDTLERFGDRFSRRVLTAGERRYVRGRAETMAGRWAAKEAVSKVLGLGVRGIGWQEIEVERLPTGQPAVRLHGRAAARADQLGMGRVALSISHDTEYAVAIAFAVRTNGGRYVFPPDIDDRLDETEARILARIERIRGLAEQAPAGKSTGEQSAAGRAPATQAPVTQAPVGEGPGGGTAADG